MHARGEAAEIVEELAVGLNGLGPGRFPLVGDELAREFIDLDSVVLHALAWGTPAQPRQLAGRLRPVRLAECKRAQSPVDTAYPGAR